MLLLIPAHPPFFLALCSCSNSSSSTRQASGESLILHSLRGPTLALVRQHLQPSAKMVGFPIGQDTLNHSTLGELLGVSKLRFAHFQRFTHSTRFRAMEELYNIGQKVAQVARKSPGESPHLQSRPIFFWLFVVFL